MYSFATPHIKLKLGHQNKWVTTNSKPPGPINHYDYDGGIQRNTEQQVRSYLLHTFMHIYA
jgi:hypothetical protein